MKISKNIFNFDYILFFTMLTLTITGIFFIYSANLNKPAGTLINIFPYSWEFFRPLNRLIGFILSREYLKQLVFSIVALFFFFVTVFLLSLKRVKETSIIFYGVCVVGLIVTLFFPKVMGQRRIDILGVSIQFSDFMKIAATLVLSWYYSANQKEIKEIKTYLVGCAIVFFPVAIILLHPDLGSALVYIPILLGISFMAGIRKSFLLYTVLLFAMIAFIPIVTTINNLFYNNENELIYLLTNVKYVMIVFLTLITTCSVALIAYLGLIKGIGERLRVVFYWYLYFSSIILIGLSLSYPVNSFVLKQYQKDRLLIFFDPYIDPQGKGYNIIQSMNTIGNGGFFGKGWKRGEQIQNFFLPEQATDFIYPVIAEEKGFIGSMFILILYMVMFARMVLIALKARDYWSSYVVIGLASMFLFHILENIGMCIGIMPITGIPLPFISYGGSFLLSCYISIALIININLNRFQF